jgi:sterol desaturase/sphingolipid hydroxylase (fatty acid hydroxylase superfamily)
MGAEIPPSPKLVSEAPQRCAGDQVSSGRSGRASRVTVALTFFAAVAVATLVRERGAFGIALLFVLFVPIEKAFALRRQRVFRPGLFTDLTHLLVNSFIVAGATVAVAVALSLQWLWVRKFHLVDHLPTAVAVVLAIVLVFVGDYWGHRLSHQVPFLWRFHSVHHSIEHMDWVASGRLHPLDSGFTRAFTIMPLLLLGYRNGVFAGAAAVVTLIALFQHANVRLRFPVVRWVLPTPEWHHWHHSSEPEAIDKNFGLPVVDKIFGTAFLPAGRHAETFGTSEPVPADGYFRHLAYPFRKRASIGI